MNKKLHVHFMGIGGSGAAPIAIIAKKSGFIVTGCDYHETSYSGPLIDNDIEVLHGHDVAHLIDVDILAVSPAIFDINPDHPELLEGKRRGILMTWQEFMGKYLHKDKYLLAIAGTHGKSTSTVLAGLTLEAGGLDPMVQAGTIYEPWKGGYRIAHSDYFVSEADEFNCNFLNYSPSMIILNNVEMDHPEFFSNFDAFKLAFKKFIKQMTLPGILIVNEESQGIRDILMDLKEWLSEQPIKVIGHYIHKSYDLPIDDEYKIMITDLSSEGVTYNIQNDRYIEGVKIGLLGEHNVQNSVGVLCAALELGIDLEAIKGVFEDFKGVGRRTELAGEINHIRVYDDYGHHPTAISAVLNTFKQIYPEKRVIAVVEPHQISRLKLFPDEFIEALGQADYSIVTKSFLGREINKHMTPIDMDDFVKHVNGKAEYIEAFDQVTKRVGEVSHPEDIVIVFGAGNSSQLTQMILGELDIHQS